MAKIIREQYRELVVYDPATYDSVRISHLLPPESFSTHEEYFQTGAGTRRIKRREHFLEVPAVDFENLYQLYRWRDAETKVNAVLLGAQRHVQWYEDTIVQIVPSRPIGPGLARDVVRLYHGKKDADISHNVNLLWHTEWADDDSSGTADGWSLSGTGTTSFSGDEQTVTHSSTSAVDFAKAVDLPIAGPAVTFAVDFTSLNSNADDQIVIQARSKSGTTLDSSLTQPTATGIASATLTLPANTDKLRAVVRSANGSGTSGSASFKWPTLRTDGKAEITRY